MNEARKGGGNDRDPGREERDDALVLYDGRRRKRLEMIGLDRNRRHYNI